MASCRRTLLAARRLSNCIRNTAKGVVAPNVALDIGCCRRTSISKVVNQMVNRLLTLRMIKVEITKVDFLEESY